MSGDEPVDETREAFADALAGWGMTPTQIAETLEATAFGLGLVELRPAAGGPSDGVALVVDDRRDPELRELFAWRERTSAEAVTAAWKHAETPQVRVVLGPDKQALVRFGVTILAPAALERRFLYAVGAIAGSLTKLQVVGTTLWLVPSTVIEKSIARGGPAGSFDVVDLCLRVGRVREPFPTIDEALAHVGSPRETQTMRPMNRAERRAAARYKG